VMKKSTHTYKYLNNTNGDRAKCFFVIINLWSDCEAEYKARRQRKLKCHFEKYAFQGKVLSLSHMRDCNLKNCFKTLNAITNSQRQFITNGTQRRRTQINHKIKACYSKMGFACNLAEYKLPQVRSLV